MELPSHRIPQGGARVGMGTPKGGDPRQALGSELSRVALGGGSVLRQFSNRAVFQRALMSLSLLGKYWAAFLQNSWSGMAEQRPELCSYLVLSAEMGKNTLWKTEL